MENQSNSHLIMVTGGQRCGKSLFAEKLALSLSSDPFYIASAVVADDEMRQRVEIHQKRRGNNWHNIEEPLNVGSIDLPKGCVALLDCLTLLASNWLFKSEENISKATDMVCRQIDTLLSKEITVIAVTNEIGLGGISSNVLQRKFTDLQGTVNQYVATLANEVYLLISGIPVKIK